MCQPERNTTQLECSSKLSELHSVILWRPACLPVDRTVAIVWAQMGCAVFVAILPLRMVV